MDPLLTVKDVAAILKVVFRQGKIPGKIV